jgi:ring-1,2-phenylacetyl-CoA epoxidase subunit PaaC
MSNENTYKQYLVDYTLHLADTALIMGHRLSEWTSRGPMLEQDIAISNIALDLVGQCRNFYQYAALLKQDGSTEDTLAYLRDAHEFKNVLLAEIPNGDWAKTMLKLFLFSTYQYYFYHQLESSADAQLAAIAEKSLKEVTYHKRWSSEWVIRMGDGTEESHRRMENALPEVWGYTDELFDAAPYETELLKDGITVDLMNLRHQWLLTVEDVLSEATLSVPQSVPQHKGGKEGKHTSELVPLLAEMQELQRAYPGCEW